MVDVTTAGPVLVVGASGVLGREISTQLASVGATVWGTAQSGTTLGAIPAAVTQSFECDLANPASIDALATSIRNRTGALGGVVIAAGLVAFGLAKETPHAVVERLVAVNAVGPIRTITGLTDLLAADGGGFIVTLSGKIVEIPTAGMSAYSASKSALHAFAVAATRELRRDGVMWLDARPPHTETGLVDRAVFGTAPQFGAGLSPDVVAARIVSAIVNDERDLPSEAFA